MRLVREDNLQCALEHDGHTPRALKTDAQATYDRNRHLLRFDTACARSSIHRWSSHVPGQCIVSDSPCRLWWVIVQSNITQIAACRATEIARLGLEQAQSRQHPTSTRTQCDKQVYSRRGARRGRRSFVTVETPTCPRPANALLQCLQRSPEKSPGACRERTRKVRASQTIARTPAPTPASARTPQHARIQGQTHTRGASWHVSKPGAVATR